MVIAPERKPWIRRSAAEPSRLFNDAVSDHVEIESAPVTAPPFSMACWFTSDDATVVTTMMSVCDSTASSSYHNLQYSGTALGDPVRVQSRDPTGTSTANSLTGTTLNKWHHACGVWASTTSRTIYLDGGNQRTDTESRTPTGINRTAIGWLADSSPTNYFSGKILEAAVWKVALTGTEVFALARGAKPWTIRPNELVFCPDMGNLYDPFTRTKLAVTGTVIKAPRTAWRPPMVRFT